MTHLTKVGSSLQCNFCYNGSFAADVTRSASAILGVRAAANRYLLFMSSSSFSKIHNIVLHCNLYITFWLTDIHNATLHTVCHIYSGKVNLLCDSPLLWQQCWYILQVERKIILAPNHSWKVHEPQGIYSLGILQKCMGTDTMKKINVHSCCGWLRC